MSSITSAKIKLALSMATFGTVGLFVKGIPLPSAEIALYRAVLAAILIGAFLLIRRQKINFKAIKKALPLLAVSGIAIGFNWVLLFEAYKYTTVSSATLAYYFAPVIVTLLCPILFKEKMRPIQWVCFLMSSLGIILITGLDTNGNSFFGILLGLGAACLYATVILLNKYIKDVNGTERTLLQFLFSIVVLLPYVLFSGGINLASLDTKGWVLLLVVGFVHTGVTYCMYFSSLKELSGQTVAILSYIDPLVAILASVIILHEKMSPLQIVGGALILGFTLLNEISATKKERL